MLGRSSRSSVPRLRGALAALTLVGALVLPRSAEAQLHGDASAQVGVMKRFVSDRPAGVGDAGFGPAAQVAAHVALLPLVRVGVYAGYDLSPSGGDAAARDIVTLGARAKVMSPWPRGTFRTWGFVGFGYGFVHARGYDTTVTDASGQRANAEVASATGGFLEVPVGIGASCKLRKPLELSAELGFRFGFANHGDVYADPGPAVTAPGLAGATSLPGGVDRYALGLTLGVLLDL